MLEFLSQNIGTIAVLAIVIAIVAGIVAKMIKNKKQGKSGCGCGCDGCANSEFCHPKK